MPATCWWPSITKPLTEAQDVHLSSLVEMIESGFADRVLLGDDQRWANQQSAGKNEKANTDGGHGHEVPRPGL